MELAPQAGGREGAGLWTQPTAGMGRKAVPTPRERCRGRRDIPRARGREEGGGKLRSLVISRAKLRPWKAASTALAEGEGTGPEQREPLGRSA